MDNKEKRRLITEFLGFKFGYYDTYEDEGDEYNYSWTLIQEPIIYKDDSELTDNLVTKHSEQRYYKKYHKGYNDKLDYSRHYESDLELLMKAIEKIEDSGIGVKICCKVVEVYIDETKEILFTVKEKTKRESLFVAIIKFINEYTNKTVTQLIKNLDIINTFIAEFHEERMSTTNFHDRRGFVKTYLAPLGSPHEMDNLNFHSDWNWIMPIISKIEKLGIEVEIKKNLVVLSGVANINDEFIEYYWNGGVTDDDKLTSTWYGISEFIKWFNWQKIIKTKTENLPF